MKIIYVKETKKTCDIIKRIIRRIKKFFNIIKIQNIDNKTIYYLPIFRDSKLSKYSVKRISTKINKLLEKDELNIIVLSEYLYKNKLLKNYLYSKNINILDGRYLFKCLIHSILEYIFKIKNKKMEFRRSFITN